MFKLTLIFILLFPMTGLAQYAISGRVLNMTDKKPVSNASVFLNNATVGGKTSDNGTFMLTGVRPGQYELIVSIVGYESYRQTFIVASNITIPDIEILPKTIQLKEVSIKPDPNWERNYAAFKRLFLGTSDYAQQCKILNPEMLDLEYDPVAWKLTAKSFDALQIENSALGYKIKYMLTDFMSDGKTGMLYYEGTAFFEEMKGSPSQQRRWQKKRLNAYQGSAMHFLRAALARNITSEGFKGFTVIRKPNPAYKGGRDAKFIQSLINKRLEEADMIKLTDKKGLYALYSPDHLYVFYTKKRDHSWENTQVTDPLHMPEYPSTIITFDEPYGFFDDNGIIVNPHSIIFEGYWGQNRVAELLPVDYVPVVEK